MYNYWLNVGHIANIERMDLLQITLTWAKIQPVIEIMVLVMAIFGNYAYIRKQQSKRFDSKADKDVVEEIKESMDCKADIKYVDVKVKNLEKNQDSISSQISIIQDDIKKILTILIEKK